MRRACHRLIASLLVVLPVLPGPALASTLPAAAGEVQRLHWRINELEGELAALRQFADQQDASIGRLQARAEASASRVRAAVAGGMGLALLAGGATVWALRRRRPGAQE